MIHSCRLIWLITLICYYASSDAATRNETFTPTNSSSSRPKFEVSSKLRAKLFNRTSSSFEKCFTNDVHELNDHLSVGQQENSRTLIHGLYRFSINMLKSLHNFESRDTSTGILVSPFSIWSALVVSYMGARGDTDRELRVVLGLDDVPKYAVGMAYQGLRFWYKLKKNATGASKKFAYSVANKIFVNKQLQLDSCIDEHFGVEVEAMDFVGDPYGSTQKINAWVEQTTNNKIKDLIPNGAITPWTNIIIANAIYFHSKWLNQFDPAKNEIRSFHVSPTEDIPVQMMIQTGTFMFGVSENLRSTILDIPYANQDFSMLIILPETSKGVDSLVRNLSPQDLDTVINNLYDDEVYLALPRFKFEQEFELAGPLYSMGIKKLFDPRFSDLSGFFASVKKSNDSNFPAIGITVNSIVHKSFISVNEEGTEAAAATALLIARSGRPAFPTQFVVDRPFVYLIRDTATNVILFMGIVRRPQE
ncbi:serpin SMSB4 variant-like protein [Dinothrombium tinctorium]|uniref:Serpin SMSB4 variant-like protein n=1 Tax=Dinothrombium tinctorium TaxID=1965070 RepID=A0A3S3QXJ3_9ACAR|nr:serpin SMSB4 variant-like protein [Dinothrombium tinctorium]RWS15540.1 serpin SMSB4 variant-like protein [Dinothrombium tinctorium]